MPKLFAKNKIRKKKGNYWLLVLTLAISLFGVLMEFSASYYVSLSDFGTPFYYLKSALMWFCIGWALFIITAIVDYHFWSNFAIFALIGGFGLLLLLYTPLGKTLNNATRWIEIGPITIMPGEIFKTCAILFFAWLFSLDSKNIKSWRTILLSLGIAVAAFVLIYLQPNLSTAATVVVIIAGMMFLAGLYWKLIALGIGCGVAGIAGLVLLKGGYQLQRVTGFLDPWANASSSGYQVCQGLLALGSGGLFGVGLGKSVQKAIYLPEPMNDFILAIIGEELGFIGVSALLVAYLVLLFIIIEIGMKCEDRFGMLIAGGTAIHIGIQVIYNVAVVTASAPATGIALPLITLGGNSLITFMIELGMVYNISRHKKKNKETEA